MEKGKILLVIYHDGNRPQAKRMMFLEKDNSDLLKFKMMVSGKTTYLHAKRIIRMEEIEEEVKDGA